MASDAPPERSKQGAPRGQFLVIAMLGVAVAAATFAWWWNFQRGRKALEFYGPAAATLIRTAPKVELSRDGEPVRDISKAKGLLNARTSLLGDASYQWNAEGQFANSDATLRFTDGERSVLVSFDFENQTISANRKIVLLSQKTADGWRIYLERLGPEGRQEIAPAVRPGNQNRPSADEVRRTGTGSPRAWRPFGPLILHGGTDQTP